MVPLELPGADLVNEGLADLAVGGAIDCALHVLIGAPRLRAPGVIVPEASALRVEHRLDLLAADGSDTARVRYNALLRRLVRFEQALACGERPSGRPPA